LGEGWVFGWVFSRTRWEKSGPAVVGSKVSRRSLKRMGKGKKKYGILARWQNQKRGGKRGEKEEPEQTYEKELQG